MDCVTTRGMTVTKAIIAEDINQEIGLSKEDSAAIIDDILDEIKTSLVKDGIVKISSFGTFSIKKKKERPGNVPNTSKKVIIQARNSVSFRPSKVVKKLINNQ
ncbi:integration host factor subunit alpha [Wolbachia endosymbiont of Litomosoides sigmodontis]|uniref:integration host factor subunit alpha n=1 Tax=Wolbachia endosymbiont of Litomosoides sigmodontis TaxID=80850 RepID=UPI001589AD44|nr:integration host factor subunit alpha [Wolbachia endosymbiont of Litomosoides sigmodontis]QKX03096.1 integration host factor subunit alpha [Wolbachia endosymbiont of Litomosoides sigmodontis]